MGHRVLLTLAVLAAACGPAAPASGHAQATPAASGQHLGPPWPAVALAGLAPTGTGCQPHRSVDYVEPARYWPTSLTAMAQGAQTVAVADAVDQKAYWLFDPLGPGRDGFSSWTVTNFKVIDAVKGSPGSWLQLEDAAARPQDIPSCSAQADLPVNDTVPQVGRRYVLFVWQLPGQPGPAPMSSWFRFPIVGGNVESEAALNPQALALPVHAQPLGAFLQAAGLPSN